MLPVKSFCWRKYKTQRSDTDQTLRMVYVKILSVRHRFHDVNAASETTLKRDIKAIDCSVMLFRLESSRGLLLRLPEFQRTFLWPLVEFFKCLQPAGSLLLLLLIVTAFPIQNEDRKRDCILLITPAQSLKGLYLTNLSLKIKLKGHSSKAHCFIFCLFQPKQFKRSVLLFNSAQVRSS